MTDEEHREWLLNTVKESQCVSCKHCVKITQQYSAGAYVHCPKLGQQYSIRTILYCKYYKEKKHK